MKKENETDQNDDQERWEPKTMMRISHWISFVGWFPFMFLCAYGSRLSTGPMLTILFLGLALCIIGPVLSMYYTSNPVFWKRYEEIEELKQDYRIFKAKYQKALAEFVKNQKVKNE